MHFKKKLCSDCSIYKEEGALKYHTYMFLREGKVNLWKLSKQKWNRCEGCSDTRLKYDEQEKGRERIMRLGCNCRKEGWWLHHYHQCEGSNQGLREVKSFGCLITETTLMNADCVNAVLNFPSTQIIKTGFSFSLCVTTRLCFTLMHLGCILFALVSFGLQCIWVGMNWCAKCSPLKSNTLIK